MTGFIYRINTIRLLLIGVCVLFTARMAEGQGIHFDIPDDDINYALYLTPLGGYESLDFNTAFGFLIAGQSYDIELNSEDLVILEISGVRYLDVFVTLDSEPYLYLGGIQTMDEEKRFGFTLKSAYANRGEGNTGPGYRTPFSGTAARFPIFRRTSGPPGPPPVPPHSGYVPPRETAYLFLYGGIVIPSAITAGSYESQITVTIEYDL